MAAFTGHSVVLTSMDRLQVKSKFLPYLLPSVGHGADPSLQAVSPQVALSHPPAGRLPLLSARTEVTFPPEEHHCPSASTKLYCLMTEAHWCEQLAQGYDLTVRQPGLELTTSVLPVRCLSH